MNLALERVRFVIVLLLPLTIACCFALASAFANEDDNTKDNTNGGDRNGSVRPSVDLTPQDVVRLQLQAMANNDARGPDAGIITAFQFASPANKLQTGPISKFLKIVRHPSYIAMIDNIGLEFGETLFEANKALVPVIVTAANGADFGYLFSLSRQSLADCDGCWMTDSVTPMPLPSREDDKGTLL